MSTFDPKGYLTNLKGKDYLEVKWRLVWLRETHPNADLATELVEHRLGEFALFKATVTIPERGSATGYGSETPRDFGDYIEKAETKAIGRALGALGFGTQFTFDFDEDMTPGRERIADSPVSNPKNAAQTHDVAPGRAQASNTPIDFSTTRGRRLADPDSVAPMQARAGLPPTPAQFGKAHGIARDLGWSEAGLHRFAGVDSLSDLDRKGLSEVIDGLLKVPSGTPEPAGDEPPFEAAPSDLDPDAESWSAFWKEAKALGITGGREGFRKATGTELPLQIADARAALALVKRQA